MYCVKCGVELADSERKCPLCHTPVYFPGLSDPTDRPYPEVNGGPDRVNPRGIYFIVSFIFLITGAISLFCDMNFNGEINWSGYVLGGLLLAYVIFVLPGWFLRYHPAIFVPCDFAAAALYVEYVNYKVEGDWFITFALPLTAIIALIVCSVVILCHYVKRGYLYIFGGAFIALGAASALVEWLIHLTFNYTHPHVWFFYPLITFSLIGVMLIVIAIVKPLRESLCRIFSI